MQNWIALAVLTSALPGCNFSHAHDTCQREGRCPGVDAEGGSAGVGGGGSVVCTYPKTVTITVSSITGATRWESGIYTLESSLTVSGGVLQVDACTKIMMPIGGTITVRNNGALSLSGANGQIIITSSQPSPLPGDWNYVEFEAKGDSANNKLENVVVEYGGGADSHGAIYVDSGARVAMSNSIVRFSNDFGVEVQSGGHLASFTGNTLINNALGPIKLGANSVDDLGAGTYTPNTVEGVLVVGEAVAHDATWFDLGVPYVAENGFSVSNATGTAHLTISAGVILKLGTGGTLSVWDNGGLTLAGTAAKPITVTSMKGAPAAGDWGYIGIYATSSAGVNAIDHAVIEYGGGGSHVVNHGAISVASGAQLHMKDTTVRKSKDFGVALADGAKIVDFTGNTLTENDLGPIKLGPNSVDALGANTYTPNTVEGVFVVNEAVAHDATWLDLGVPYVAENGFSVSNATGTAHLTISAGVILKLGTGGTLSVRDNGGLTLAGTAAKPITVTSMKGAPAAGDWDSIDINSTSSAGVNAIDHAVIEYGGGGRYGANHGAIYVRSGAQLHMKDTTVKKSKDFGVVLGNGARIIDFTGNTLTENDLGPITLGANTVDSLGVGTYSGNTVEGIVVRSEAVSHDAQWLNLGVPYIAPTGFRMEVANGSAVLTIDPGVTLKLGAGASVSVWNNGGLTLNGNSTSRVTVTSAKSAPSAGDWNEINIFSTSVGARNVFKYADINYGGGSSYGSLWVGSTGVTLDHVTFTNSKTCDLDALYAVTATASPFVACP